MGIFKEVKRDKKGVYPGTVFHREVKNAKGEVVLEHDGRTRQEFKKECDRNHIVAKFGGLEKVPNITGIVPVFGDMTKVPNLVDVLDKAAAGREAFMALPPKVRERFGNDVLKLIEFIKDDENYDEALKLGLVEKKPSKEQLAEAELDKPLTARGLREALKDSAAASSAPAPKA